MYNNPQADAKDAKKNLRNAKNELADAGFQVKSNLEDAAHNAGEKIRHLYDSASGEIKHVANRVTSEINNKPVQSSAIALAVGFLLGALFRRA